MGCVAPGMDMSVEHSDFVGIVSFVHDGIALLSEGLMPILVRSFVDPDACRVWNVICQFNELSVFVNIHVGVWNLAWISHHGPAGWECRYLRFLCESFDGEGLVVAEEDPVSSTRGDGTVADEHIVVGV